MSWETIITITIAVLSIVAAPFIHVWRTTMQRIDSLEAQIDSKVTDIEVREIVTSKIEPLKENMQSVDRKLDFIIEQLIKKS